MENTVLKTQIETHWHGLYQVYELKQFKDDRGMVCETFRLDDSILKDSKMCYISETEPFVLRGPHQHSNQTDNFISWKTTMIYQMYNPDINETRYFITDPNKIYLVKVAPPIIHSYRNISICDISKTLNYPTSLFMGEGKKEPIDEIRHEHKIENNINIYVLGCTGRLGKSLTDSLFMNVQDHTYNIIPISHRFKEGTYVQDLDMLFELVTKNNKTGKDIIVNCIAKTIVQNDKENFDFANLVLPAKIMSKCIEHKIYNVLFSTDYIFQTGQLSPYTQSKIKMEDWLNTQFLVNRLYCEKYIKLIRVANLFSQNTSDTNNMINKFMDLINKNNPKMKVPQGLQVMPTDCDILAEYLVENYLLRDMKSVPQYFNISGKSYDITDLLVNKFGVDKNIIEYFDILDQKVVNHPELFLKLKNYVELDCDDAIISKIQSLKE